MSDWTPIQKERGSTIENHSIPAVPEPVEFVEGWHWQKAESVSIYTDGEAYWVVGSIARRNAGVDEFDSERSAEQFADEIKGDGVSY